jgi:hypothetical protein
MCLIVTIGWALWDRYVFPRIRSRAHVTGETYARVGKLAHRVNSAFVTDSVSFIEVVGTGIVVRGDSFPLALRTNLSYGGDMDDGRSFSDAWGNPLNVTITWREERSNSDSPGGAFSVYVWSDGPNGRNEQQAGDDIAVSPPSIEITNLLMLERIRRHQDAKK